MGSWNIAAELCHDHTSSGHAQERTLTGHVGTGKQRCARDGTTELDVVGDKVPLQTHGGVAQIAKVDKRLLGFDKLWTALGLVHVV